MILLLNAVELNLIFKNVRSRFLPIRIAIANSIAFPIVHFKSFVQF